MSSGDDNKEEESDINKLFADIFLTEERTAQRGYAAGFQRGQEEGNKEGYQLGYAQGVQLGQELGSIYGAVIAHQQSQHSDKIQKILQNLRNAIENFPKDNNPEADIIGAIEDIRVQDKRLKAMLGSKYKTVANQEDQIEKKDLSF